MNLRTYVHDDQGRPGVWFDSLDCNQSVAVWTARTLFHLPYQNAQMSANKTAAGMIHYRSQRRGEAATSEFAYRLKPEPHQAKLGSLEFFLAERYLLFTQTSSGLRCGRVHHAPYPLAEVELEKWDKYLRQQLPGLDHAPIAFLSAKEGTNVEPVMELLFELRQQAQTQMSTGRLNAVLHAARDKLLPQGRGQFPKLFYGTQIGTEPITLLVFVNEPKLFDGQYERYLSQVLRDNFPCPEVPIRIVFRRREKVVLDDRSD